MGQKYNKSCDVWDSPAKKELSCNHLTFRCPSRHLLDEESLFIYLSLGTKYVISTIHLFFFLHSFNILDAERTSHFILFRTSSGFVYFRKLHHQKSPKATLLVMWSRADVVGSTEKCKLLPISFNLPVSMPPGYYFLKRNDFIINSFPFYFSSM